MKKLQAQLKAVAKTLASLTKKIESVIGQLEKTGAAAAKPVKKAKVAVKKAVKAKTARAVKVAKAAKPKKAVKAVKAKKATKAPKAAKAPKAPKAPKAKKADAEQGTVLDLVYDVVKNAEDGASIDTLKKKTNLEPRQLSNALYKLTKKAMIEARSRGVYFKK